MTSGIPVEEIVAAVLEDLRAWKDDSPPQKIGAVSVATDPFHVLELLATSPRGTRIILHYAGFAPETSATVSDLGEQRLDVVVGYSLGLTAHIDEAVAVSRPDRPSLLAILDAVYARMKSLIMPADGTERVWMLKGIAPVATPEGVPLAAYRMTFGLMALLPEPPDESDRDA